MTPLTATTRVLASIANRISRGSIRSDAPIANALRGGVHWLPQFCQLGVVKVHELPRPALCLPVALKQREALDVQITLNRPELWLTRPSQNVASHKRT